MSLVRHLTREQAFKSIQGGAGPNMATMDDRRRDASNLVLADADVPSGFKKLDSAEHAFAVGDEGRAVSYAHRMYGKRRLLGRGKAIWSEATVFEDEDTAHQNWVALVKQHKARPFYDDVQEIAVSYGDESYVHDGVIGGKPGLWAAVRAGTVLHRLSTDNLGVLESGGLLRRQLGRSTGLPHATPEAKPPPGPPTDDVLESPKRWLSAPDEVRELQQQRDSGEISATDYRRFLAFEAFGEFDHWLMPPPLCQELAMIELGVQDEDLELVEHDERAMVPHGLYPTYERVMERAWELRLLHMYDWENEDWESAITARRG